MNDLIRFSTLRTEMVRKQITIKQLAEKIGVNRDTMGGKLSGKRPLLLREAFIITRTFFPDKNIIDLFKELYEESETEKVKLKKNERMNDGIPTNASPLLKELTNQEILKGNFLIHGISEEGKILVSFPNEPKEMKQEIEILKGKYKL